MEFVEVVHINLFRLCDNHTKKFIWNFKPTVAVPQSHFWPCSSFFRSLYTLSQIWQAKGFRRNSWICKRTHRHHAVQGRLERIYSTGRPQSWVLATAPMQEGFSLLISIFLLTIPLSLQKWTSKQKWADLINMISLSFWYSFILHKYSNLYSLANRHGCAWPCY